MCRKTQKDIFELVKNKLDITFANEQEIMSLIDVKKIEDVIEFSKSIKKLIVITRGEKGSYCESIQMKLSNVLPKKIKIKDLTGAGDLFAGGFLHGYINQKSIKESLEKGTELSSKIIQIIGARLT